MRRLTAEQQALVLEHIDQAWDWAKNVRTCLPFDERRSIALKGLCEAAIKCPAEWKYSPYAYQFVRLAILNESRRWRGPGYRYSSRKERLREYIDLDTFVSREDMMADIETRELAQIFRCRFSRLRNSERLVLELYCDGHQLVEIATMIGVKYAAVKKMRQRAAEKLLS